MKRLAVKDLLVMGGAAVLLVCVFLPFYSLDLSVVFGTKLTYTVWHWPFLSVLVLGFAAGIAAGVLTAVDRFTGARCAAGKFGLSLGQLTGVLAVVSFVQLLLGGLLSGRPLPIDRMPALGHTAAQWLALVAALALVLGTVLAGWVPALSTPVGGGHVGGVPTTGFWFGVTAPTPVHDAATGTVRAQLQPGRWYLASASYGTAWQVSDQEFGTAVLHDLSGVLRADQQHV